MRRVISMLLVLMAAVAVGAPMQAPGRHATTAQALARYGHFFHGAQVAFLGTVAATAGIATVPLSERQQIVIAWAPREATTGPALLRGMFLDLGRLERDDARLSGIDVQQVLDAANQGRWPGREQLFLLVDAASSRYDAPAEPDLRDIALDPARYAGKSVTVAGRFRGRNLLGDQPAPPGRSPHEFVVRVGDASVWVSGLRPRGRGFTLDPDARRDTSEWVRVSGVVQADGALGWIEGRAIDLTRPVADTTPLPAPPPQGPPPEIIFSAPLDGESDVPTDIVLRVQFSRAIDPDSLRGQVAVAYGVSSPDALPPPAPAATTTYRPANRSVEIRFSGPLAPFTPVFVAFGNGVRALDGAAMKPSRLSFTTGR